MSGFSGIVCTLTKRYTIEVAGKRYVFEIMPYCGLGWIGKRGDPIETSPPKRVWNAVNLWTRQGQRVGEDGLCVWDPPPLVRLVHLGGNNYREAREGERADRTMKPPLHWIEEPPHA